ncbi:MAG: single-stranded-DNA-specific exonuclease RecJ, partial [Gammaproteobacteria bacterium]|nr:single-stranded-DNA-specific exonuclease RecJ [Gammaproteobacteria bacterium]
GSMGAQIHYVVPDRKKHGYGLSPAVVDLTLRHDPKLLITVDNGISSIEGVAAAKRLGMTVLVTDHHLPGERLPEADVIVNPNQAGEVFGSPHLAGVGVAFYLVCAVRQALKSGYNPATLLDLVALGTVADVVQLDKNNRILVNQGIQRIRQGHASGGVTALLAVAGREASRIVAADFGFALGPRVNAAGRMTEMGAGIECLLAESRQQARPLAEALEQINHQRRTVEGDVREEAESIVASLSIGEENSAAGIALYQPHWHEGVIGIVAGRIKEQLHRPVIVFARGEEGLLKGSARSIQGIHMRDLIDAVARQREGLVVKFGGHAMAAGLTIHEKDFATFRSGFQQLVAEWATAEILEEILYTDGSLPSSERSLESAHLLRQSGPWGQGFPEPVFEDEMVLDGWRIVGERHLKLRLKDITSGEVVDAIAFNQSEVPLPQRGGEVRVVYRLDVNYWQGRENLQLMVVAIAASG